MGVEYQKNRKCNWIACVITIAVAVAAAVVTVVIIKHKKSGSGGSSTPAHTFDSNYTQALELALKFIDIQKSGKLPANFPIAWRGDSNLQDGSDNSVDLSGGLYDAGDSIKFGLPLAFTATLLSWSVLEYSTPMQKAGQLTAATDAIRWVTDYLLKAHTGPEELYYQVGDPVKDHKCWEKPENNDVVRPSYKLNATSPGTEVAAETAAAMAAASMVFRSTDTNYSDTLIASAKTLFNFSDTYKASYILANPDVQAFYNSTGFGDELLWGAAWLYYATGDNTYLAYVTGANGQSYAQWNIFPAWFSWDNKLPGVWVLLARLQLLKPPSNQVNTVSTGLTNYKNTADGLMCAFLPQSKTATGNRTEGGLLWVQEWSSLQHSINSALLTTFYSDYLSTAKQSGIDCSGTTFTPQQLRTFAISQADYVLGDNNLQQSYLVGYGSKYPKYLHHRGASIPSGPTTYDCNSGYVWYHSADPNPNVGYGAVVGGPAKNETYTDARDNIAQNEASVYNSVSMAGLVAGLSVNGSYSVPVSWI